MRIRKCVYLAVFLTLSVQLAGAQAPKQDIATPTPAIKDPKPAATPAKPVASGKGELSPASVASPGASVAASASKADKTVAPSVVISAGATPSPAATVTTSKGENITITVNAPPPVEPVKSNNWAAGVIGIALMGGLGYFGWRYAQKRGMSVPDALQKMGVEMPQDSNSLGARPLKPIFAPEPPLPSLAELPVVGPAPRAVVAPGASSSVEQAYAGSPRLLGMEGAFAGESLELTEGFTLGREAENTLAITQDNAVSRRHAIIEQVNGVWNIKDAGSSNGTYVNGVRIDGVQNLQTGDEIQIGSSVFRFES